MAEGPYEEDDQAIIPAFVPALGLPPAPRRHLLPRAVAALDRRLRRAGGRPRDELLPPGRGRERRLERGGGGGPPQPAGVRRTAPGRRPAPLHRTRRPPARACPSRSSSGPGTSPRGADEPAVLARLLRARRAAVGGPDLHPLPARARDQAGREEAERARVASFHERRARGDHLLQPDDLHDPPALRRGGGRRRARRRTRRASRTCTATARSRASTCRSSTSRARAGRDLYGQLLREAVADGHDGWMEDFGEYTPLDARAADGTSGSALHNAYPRQYHCGAFGGVAGVAARPRALRPLGLDRQRPLLADRVGRRPDRGLGLRRAPLGRDQRAHDGAVRA